MKICNKCKQIKSEQEFAKDKYNKDGYTYACKECRNKDYNQRAKANPEAIVAKNKRSIKKRKMYYQSDAGISSSRRAHLKRKFNITLEEYNRMLKLQDGKCAICNKEETSSRNNFLSVDHNHDTGEIRGLLCNICNRALGMFKDDPNILQGAINYLKQQI